MIFTFFITILLQAYHFFSKSKKKLNLFTKLEKYVQTTNDLYSYQLEFKKPTNTLLI